LSSAVKTDIANGKFLSFINIPHSSIALAIKKTIDINLSIALIVILFPVFILISVLIKLTSKGPVICKLEMPGLRGHQFDRYNFRTVISNPDKTNTDPGSEILEDSQVTKIGRFLRKSGLDELPQLFNVLKGDIPMFDSSHHIKSYIPDHP
jgi:lipopolysaccharide/colanic/teichoic acid biosynthesis glycosyltransferase